MDLKTSDTNTWYQAEKKNFFIQISLLVTIKIDIKNHCKKGKLQLACSNKKHFRKNVFHKNHARWYTMYVYVCIH